MRALLILALLSLALPGDHQDARPVDAALVQRFIDADSAARREMAATAEISNAAFRTAVQQAAQVHSKQGRATAAMRGFEALIELGKISGLPRTEIGGMISLATVHGQIGNYDETIRLLTAALAMTEQPRDDDLIAATANNLGNVYRRRGQYAEALASYERALASNEAARREDAVARTLNNLGVIHQYQGDFRLAIDYYLRSLEIKERLGLIDDVMTTIGNIGGVFSLQGNNAQAIEYLQRALALADQSAIVRHQITTLGNLGRVLEDSGDYEAAEARLSRALQLAETSGYSEQLGMTLTALGDVEAGRRNWDRALAHLERARAIFASLGDPMGGGFAMLALARIELDRGRAEVSLELARQARDSFAAVGRPTALIDADILYGEAQTTLRRWPDAIATFERAIDLNERSLARVAGGAEDRMRYLESNGNAYAGLAHAYASAGRASAALAAAERGRSRTLLDILSAGRLADTDLTAAERARIVELDSALTALNERVAADQARARAGATPDAALAAEVDRMRQLREEFYLGLDARNPRRRFARGGTPIASERELAAALPAKSALVEFVVGPRGAWIILLSPRANGTPRLIVKPAGLPNDRLLSLAATFTKQVATRDLAFSANARALYDALFGPIDVDLTGLEQLIVVPHGGLWEVPFQALRTPRQRYLIEEHAIGYAPSASTLRALALRRRPPAAQPRVIAFGDPMLTGARLAALPNAAREAREIAGVYGAARTVVATSGEASEQRFRELAPAADIVHIATHGVLDNASPLFSYVMLAGAGAARTRDGRLEGHELINMQLGAELVVLSACDTARGRIAGGEGVVGLSWALFAAGASTTTVSLWPVDSASTTDLMSTFHRERRHLTTAGAPAPTIRALRAAQLRALARPESRHPFYWAGFVVIGAP